MEPPQPSRSSAPGAGVRDVSLVESSSPQSLPKATQPPGEGPSQKGHSLPEFSSHPTHPHHGPRCPHPQLPNTLCGFVFRFYFIHVIT